MIVEISKTAYYMWFCIDRLMESDFEMVAERLYGQMPGRIWYLDGPVVGRKEHCQVRCWDKVYSCGGQVKRKTCQ